MRALRLILVLALAACGTTRELDRLKDLNAAGDLATIAASEVSCTGPDDPACLQAREIKANACLRLGIAALAPGSGRAAEAPRLLDCAVLLPFSETILRLATECRHRHALLPPDSLIYATVLDHLRAGPPAESCFVTRDREGFDDPEIASALAEHHCRLVLEFEGAYQYVLNRLSRRSAPPAGPGPS